MKDNMPQLWLLFTTSFPYWLLSYYPFRDKMRFPWRVVMLTTVGAEALVLAVLGGLMASGMELGSMDFLFVPICLGVDLAMMGVQPAIVIFFFLFIMDYLLMLKGVSVVLLMLFFGSAQIATYQGVCIHLLLFGVTLPLMLLFLWRTASSFFEVNAPKLWRSFWIEPAFASILVMLFTRHKTPEDVGFFSFLLTRVGLLLSIFVMYYILLNTLEAQKKQIVLEQQARTREQLLELQKNQYQELMGRIEETRRARHDLRHHILMIQTYLKDGRQEELQEYIAQYAKSLPAHTSKAFCKNYTVNALTAFYAEKAETLGIAFDCHMEGLPEVLALPETDFCVLLGNLLENALNSGRKNSQGAYIRLRATSREEKMIVLTVDNGPAQQPRKMADGSLRSTSHRGQGIGTLSVRNIAEKYGGYAEFSWSDNVFYASVYLCPGTPESARP